MQYRYQVLESVLKNIAKDGSTENIFDEIARLTSDERRHLSSLMTVMEDASHQVAKDLGEYA
jgi:hypothetical protein